jgi:hypothetical protein
MPSSMLTGMAELAEDCYHPTQGRDFHGWRLSTRPGLDQVEHGNFFACAYELRRADFVTIAFRGTALKRLGDDVDDVLGIGLSLNSIVMHVTPALDFACKWASRTKNIWLTGHSLGGAYVQIVAALLNLCGITFNAPGVVHLTNQFSEHPLTKFAGGALNPTMEVLAVAANPLGEVLAHRLTGSDLVSFFTKALAADDDLAFAPVANYRAQHDPVSCLGVHVGSPPRVIQVRSALNPHAMALIVEALGGTVVESKPAVKAPESLPTADKPKAAATARPRYSWQA